jgi:leader peptidase (prepilin peptidase)/N-methyltransferase
VAAIAVLFFVLGLAVGSFLNVVIYRLPEGLSIYTPRRSFCPACRTPIRAYDNIPVLSYLLLRGRCRHCKASISIVYPLVELMTGGLFLLMFYRFRLTVELLHACIFASLLVPIVWIDLRWYIIPNAIIIAGLIAGAGLTGLIAGVNQDWRYATEHLAGAIAGGGGLALIAGVGALVFRKPAMGGGDIKLMAVIGLFLGLWPDLLLVIVISALSGSIVGLFLIALRRKGPQSPIPYGPFLAMGALLDLLWGSTLWEWYLRLTGWQ